MFVLDESEDTHPPSPFRLRRDRSVHYIWGTFTFAKGYGGQAERVDFIYSLNARGPATSSELSTIIGFCFIFRRSVELGPFSPSSTGVLTVKSRTTEGLIDVIEELANRRRSDSPSPGESSARDLFQHYNKRLR